MAHFDPLKTDHREARLLLANLARTCRTALDRAQGLFATARRELLIHGQLEHRLLYPALLAIRHPALAEQVRQAQVDWQVLELLVGRMQGRSTDDQQFSLWAWDLVEKFDRHVQSQESDLWVQAEKHLSPAVQAELEREMRDLRGALTRTAPAQRSQ